MMTKFTFRLSKIQFIKEKFPRKNNECKLSQESVQHLPIL